MSKHEVIPTGALVYGGVQIAEKGEMLSLTDMWKAAGADPAKAPAQWQRLPSAAEFIEHVSLIVGKSHDKLIETRRRAGTFGHWQVGLAYAKYLSPEFHMWCNSVVRAHMEGAPPAQVLPSDVIEQIERSFGISRMLSHKVTGIEATVQMLATTVATIAATMKPPGSGLYVQGVTSGEVWSQFDLPKIKNGARWLGNRLAEMGCQIDDCRTGRLGMRGARLYDADKASACMKNGLLHKTRVYASERMGQSRLKLVGGV